MRTPFDGPDELYIVLARNVVKWFETVIADAPIEPGWHGVLSFPFSRE
jgi:hypothetical protein